MSEVRVWLDSRSENGSEFRRIHPAPTSNCFRGNRHRAALCRQGPRGRHEGHTCRAAPGSPRNLADAASPSIRSVDVPLGRGYQARLFDSQTVLAPGRTNGLSPRVCGRLCRRSSGTLSCARRGPAAGVGTIAMVRETRWPATHAAAQVGADTAPARGIVSWRSAVEQRRDCVVPHRWSHRFQTRRAGSRCRGRSQMGRGTPLTAGATTSFVVRIGGQYRCGATGL